MKKLLFLLCTALIVCVFTACSNMSKNNLIETETIENEVDSGEIWTSDEFLAQFKTFEDNLWTFLSICCAVNYSYDDEEAKESINFWLKYAKTPVPLYVVWKTYQFETELGTKFERSDNEYYDYIPKDMVKDMILLLYNIDEDKIKWEDFKFLESEKKPDYFKMSTAFSAGYYDADILYDTLVYSPETNIITFSVKFYELGREPKEQFELCTFKYEFRTFLYKDKIQGYQFIDVELISRENDNLGEIRNTESNSITVKEIVSAMTEYQIVTGFSEGLSIVIKDAMLSSWEISGGKYGFIDRTGKLVIPCEYDYATAFREGLSAVSKDDKYGFIDKTGKIIIPLEYEYADNFSEGLAAVQTKDGRGYIDKTGALIIPCEYNYAGNFKDGLAAVRIGEKHGFIDKTGKVVVPIEYDNVCNFIEGLAVVQKGTGQNGKRGVIDTAGNVVIPFEYSPSSIYFRFGEGLIGVKKEEKWGFIDKTGTTIVPFEYDDVSYFNEGLAAVKQGEKWGYIDNSNKVILPFQYDYTGDFNDGLAEIYEVDYATEKVNRRYIDKTGTFVIPFEYELHSSFSEGLMALANNTEWKDATFDDTYWTEALVIKREWSIFEVININDAINN